ncbi:GNAT family acetyltransferase [Bifidobacterium goeldii]|uniref:GNAT family acetyltransferase n=1 Tax=Bifidobacterium goeldii TaxID=2306975 RepID=A0A430FKQ7_9BIFI|nr:GNAT family N-acetyltransferase [Bifidobacterium goeldii]RSX53417.1 GNAT family acetyltransferase [Bifidobacterium goeldii]
MAAMNATNCNAATPGTTNDNDRHHNTAASQPVIYRPMTWQDLDAIVEEFDRTWGYCSSAAGTPMSMPLSRHFVLHYLAPTTRGDIAERDGQFMGVTLSRAAGQPVLFPQAAQALADVDSELRQDPVGAQALEETLRWHEIERELERDIDINTSAPAEIELFLVAAAARGHGVGGTLWRRQMRYFVDCGVPRYFLHTDSSCDVSFYDHKGLDCEATRLAADHPEDNGTMDDVFIYAGNPRGNQPNQLKQPSENVTSNESMSATSATASTDATGVMGGDQSPADTADAQEDVR